MKLILKIAFRNILRHKGKSFVIGLILFLGALLMTIGNGITEGMNKGLQDNIINGFLGDIVIISDKQKSDNVLFEMTGKAVEPIYNFKDIKNALIKESYIEKFIPVGKNMAMALNEDSEPGWVYLLGVDFNEYKKMFPNNISLIEGDLLKNNEKGVLVPLFARKEFYNFSNVWLIPENGKIIEKNLTPEAKENKNNLNAKSNVVFMGYNNDNTTTDIRLNVKGIIKYNALNTFWGHFMIIDIESYRECLGYFSAKDKAEEIPTDKKQILNMENENLDASFSDENLVVNNVENNVIEKITFSKNVKEENVDLDSGVCNMVLIKLKNDTSLNDGLHKIEKLIKEKKLNSRVITWKQASGIIGSLSILIKGFLFGFVMFLFFVAIVIIINTLSMAALERTSEIGMMRAIGAQKSFIRNMFIGETAILSAFFGGLGIIIGCIIVYILPHFKVTTQNDMLQLLYGGDILYPRLDLIDISITIFQLILVTLLSVIYPIKVAMGITPLDAISRE